jgi:pimeloyl-ACP methyl ester carboxylesterase
MNAAPQAGGAYMNAVASDTRSDDALHPFRVNIPDAELTELRRRIAATRFPTRNTADSPPGLPLATLQKVAQYWATEYDWRNIESQLNSYPQFLTRIEGLDIHFIHVRSKHANALPIIVTHGWPGSIVEQLKIIEPLTNPTAYGGNAEDAFDVVIPSRPGCGFSGTPAAGWDCPRIARAWIELMKRLGYARYVAQGGDWGSFVTEQMGVLAPPGLLGVHTNLPSAVPAEIFPLLSSGNTPSTLTSDERRAFENLSSFLTRSLAYAQQMATHPTALFGIADSPVGLAAWYLDNALWIPGLIERAFDGQPEVLTRDDILDNITIAWLTHTTLTSTGLYRENSLPFFAAAGVTVPIAITAYPDEIYQVPRSWAERAYTRLIHFNKAAQGGHFAAWEQPRLFVDELRTGFRSLRLRHHRAIHASIDTCSTRPAI